jgi:hypothetical protein
MDRPSSIQINDQKYYNASDLKEYDPDYFYGCARTVRKIIKKKDIPLGSYEYVSYNKKQGWTIYRNEEKISNKAKLFLCKKWVLKNVPKMCKDELTYEIESAPPILELEDHEMFTDTEGNTLDIEVRGERDPEKCLFRAADVAKAFEMKNLCNDLVKPRSTYELGIDYKYFIPSTKDNVLSQTHKNKEIYLTYQGILCVLYRSRTGSSHTFRTWATRTLFTVQMGTQEAKQELVKSIGVNIDDMKSCLKASTQKMSCVYLLNLGTVANLRDTFKIKDKIKDDYIVCKFGKGIDLERRLGDHQRDYGRMTNVKISVIKYAYIDPEFINDAEVSVSHMFEITENKLKADKRKELIFINPTKLKYVEEYFSGLQKRYIGTYREQVHEIEKYENKIVILEKTHKNELLEKDFIIQQERSNVMQEHNKVRLLEKDLELEKMRNLLLSNNIKV